MRSHGFKGARPSLVQGNNVCTIHRVLHANMLDPAKVARAVRLAVNSAPHTAVFEIEPGWSPV